VLQESLGRTAEFDDLVKIGFLFFKGFQRPRLEHLHGLNMDVAVGDHEQFSVPGSQFSVVAGTVITVTTECM